MCAQRPSFYELKWPVKFYVLRLLKFCHYDRSIPPVSKNDNFLYGNEYFSLRNEMYLMNKFFCVPTGSFNLEKIQTHYCPNIHVTYLNYDLQLILILILIKRHRRLITVHHEIFNTLVTRKFTTALLRQWKIQVKPTRSELRETFKLRKVIFYMMN